MYEGVLLFGVVFLASYLFDTLTQSRSGMMFRHGRQAVLFIAIGVYFILSWRKRGQTLPMKTWNIRLVSKDGQVPSLGRLLLRYVLIWPIPLLAALLVLLASRRSDEHTSELQSLMLISYAVFCLNNKKTDIST